MKQNLALGFIKPHAAKSASVWEWVRTRLEQQSIRISMETIVSGPEIGARGLIDRHYSVIAKIGGCADPRELEMNDTACAAFRKAFGLSWTEACGRDLVFSGMEAVKRLNVNARELMAQWATVKAEKIGPGFYAARVEGIIVLNGFYPSIREIYTDRDGVVRCFLMEFDGDMLPWKRFRADVIGATDPSRAVAGSIRGDLLNSAADFGLAMSARDNVIHASASPFEAFAERAIWLPAFSPDRDPLVKALAGSGMRVAGLSALVARNPVIAANGKTASLIDHLEDLDTTEAATFIRHLNG